MEGVETVEAEQFGGPFEVKVERPTEDEIPGNDIQVCFHSKISDAQKVIVKRPSGRDFCISTIIKNTNNFRDLNVKLSSKKLDGYKPQSVLFPSRLFQELFGLPLSDQQETARATQLQTWLTDLLDHFSELCPENKDLLKNFCLKDATTEIEASGVEESKDDGQVDKPEGLFKQVSKLFGGGSPKGESGTPVATPIPPPKEIEAYLTLVKNGGQMTVQKLQEGVSCVKIYVGRTFAPKPRQKIAWLDLTDKSSPRISCNTTQTQALSKAVIFSQLKIIQKGYEGCPVSLSSKTVKLAMDNYALVLQFKDEQSATGFETTANYLRFCVNKKLDLLGDNSNFRG